MPTELLSANYDAINHSHTGATTAKVTVLIGSKPLLPLNTALANAANAFVTRASALRVQKATVTITILQPMYWDDTAKLFTNVSAGNTLVGHALAAAAGGDAEVVIDFNPLGAVA